MKTLNECYWDSFFARVDAEEIVVLDQTDRDGNVAGELEHQVDVAGELEQLEHQIDVAAVHGDPSGELGGDGDDKGGTVIFQTEWDGLVRCFLGATEPVDCDSF